MKGCKNGQFLHHRVCGLEAAFMFIFPPDSLSTDLLAFFFRGSFPCSLKSHSGAGRLSIRPQGWLEKFDQRANQIQSSDISIMLGHCRETNGEEKKGNLTKLYNGSCSKELSSTNCPRWYFLLAVAHIEEILLMPISSRTILKQKQRDKIHLRSLIPWWRKEQEYA